MESPARQISSCRAGSPPVGDGARGPAGTSRLLRSLGFFLHQRIAAASGRRADLVALNEGGEIWIVEIKSSVEDLRADHKWEDYALIATAVLCLHAGPEFDLFPKDTGLIVADAYGAHLFCEAPEHRLPARRAKLMTVGSALAARAAHQPVDRSAGTRGIFRPPPLFVTKTAAASRATINCCRTRVSP